MTDHLTKIRQFTLLSDEDKKQIAKYIVFKYHKDDNEEEVLSQRSSSEFALKSAILITTDDNVYGFGHNPNGQLGFGHNNRIPEPKLITDLCHQHIEEVFIGGHFVLATTRDHRLFVWGDYYRGRVSDVTDRYFKPMVIEFFTGKAIKEIACGDNHAMVVLEDNRVFVCGKNRETPITCVEEVYCLEGLSIKKVVSRVYDKTVLLSTDGKVYRLTADGEEYHELEATLHLNVIDICASNDKSVIYLLTDDGKIYLYNGQRLEEIDSKEKFTSLYKYGNDWPTLAVNEEFVFEVIDKRVSKTNYKTIEEYFLYKWQITHKMVEIAGREVMNVSPIGSGAFGQVFRAETGEEVFALKEVIIEDMHKDINDKNNELKIMKKTNSKFVAWLFDSWMSIDKTLLYLQMELCDYDLADLLNGKEKANIFSPLQDLVFSMEVFKELLECVQYLHSKKPKIIHRDLKPMNILVKYHDNNGHLLKLCDFGLSKIIVRETNNSCVGTDKYRAPEVSSGNYNEKADIFSLGWVLRDIFSYLILNNLEDNSNDINTQDDKEEDDSNNQEEDSSNEVIPVVSANILTESEARSFFKDMSSSSSEDGSPRKTNGEGDSCNGLESAVILTQSEARSFARQISSSSNGSLRKRPKTDNENHASGDQLIDTSSSDEGIDTQNTEQEIHDSHQDTNVESELLKTKLNQIVTLSCSMIYNEPRLRPSCHSIIKQIADISLVDNFTIDNLPDDNEFKFLKFFNKFK